MHQRLTDEEETTQKLSQQLKQVDGLKRQIEDLRGQLIECESEKKSLKTQQERFALLLKESVHQGDRIQTLKDKNSHLQAQLDEAKANEMAMTHSKNDLVEKIIKIQDENDRISIELEGLRSLLAQDNEYKLRRKTNVQSEFIEKNLTLQDVDVVGGVVDRVVEKSPKKGKIDGKADLKVKVRMITFYIILILINKFLYVYSLFTDGISREDNGNKNDAHFDFKRGPSKGSCD